MAVPSEFDMFIIGGGINGVGICRDAAGRGLSVGLCEKDDLASGTSSRSGKLIHGGLRYLEYYAFRLVRESLQERELLMAAAPHMVWPLRFVLPHTAEQRPFWLIRLGLLLYDYLGRRRRLPPTAVLNLQQDVAGEALKEGFVRGFSYPDCWVDDARLVLSNAIDAAERGGHFFIGSECIKAQAGLDGYWQIALRHRDGDTTTVRARVLINAAGPWVGGLLQRMVPPVAPAPLQLIKGSHLIVRRPWRGEHAYLFQNTDKRVVFAVPYEHDKALIGTTDIPFFGNPDEVTISAEETSYLLAAVNRYFKHPVTSDDILGNFAGVRPLYDDKSRNPSAVTRDYSLRLEYPNGAPLLSVFGGKLTTYRCLAEQVLQHIRHLLPPMGRPWTAAAVLPGGDFHGGRKALESAMQERYSWLPRPLLQQYVTRYGSRCHLLLEGCSKMADLGRHFGADLYAVEARYNMQQEWAHSAEDILWRRSQHGLQMSAEQRVAFDAWVVAQQPPLACD